MENFNVIKEVGDGTFGTVWRAINKQSGEVVAIKKMKKKYNSWEECMNLREVKSLRRMNHPNIVKLKEVIRENDLLFFVFEYMHVFNTRRKPLSNKFDDVRGSGWLDAMQSSSPLRKKFNKDFSNETESDEVDSSHRSKSLGDNPNQTMQSESAASQYKDEHLTPWEKFLVRRPVSKSHGHH